MFRAKRDKRLGSCLGTIAKALILLSRALIPVSFCGGGELVWKEQSACAVLTSDYR